MKYLLAGLAGVSSVAFAHPGHDHSSWTAPFLHALWVMPIVAAVVGIAYVLYKKHQNK